MASVSKLALAFLDKDGAKINFNYNYAEPNANGTKVKALMEGMITNGSIFSTPPAIIKSAKLITTDTNSIDLN